MVMGLLTGIAAIFGRYAVDGTLRYEDMAKYSRLANLEKDIVNQVNRLNTGVRSRTIEALKNTYLYAFEYMAYSLEKETKSRLAYSAVTMETIQAAINNPIKGLTLSETLEARRVQVITDVKRELIQGMVRGDRYNRTAERVSDIFEGDYKKAVRVVRTEGHRIQEAGQLDAVSRANKQGIIMVKKWNSLQDEKVRRGKRADHTKLDGQIVAVDEPFNLGGGRTGAAPGNTGYKEHDINCRCFVTYEIVKIEKKSVEELAGLTFDEWKKERLQPA